MSTYFPAGDVSARGTTFDVYVTEGGGWTTEYHGKRIYAGTKEELREKLMNLSRRDASTVSVPFSMGSYDSRKRSRAIRNGYVTGVHSANENLLIEWADGKREQLDRYSAGKPTMRRLDADEVAEWVRLGNARDEADQALTAFERERRLSLRDAANTAITAALKGDSDEH